MGEGEIQIPYSVCSTVDYKVQQMKHQSASSCLVDRDTPVTLQLSISYSLQSCFFESLDSFQMGPSGKASTCREADKGISPSSLSVIQVTSNLVLLWQLGLVGQCQYTWDKMV